MSAARLEELEAAFVGPLGATPTGRHVGEVLAFVDSPGGRDPRHRAIHTVLFRWPRFGVDFDRRLWWFVDPRLAAGRFRATVGPSRWRDTEVLRLEYGESRLPGRIRRMLYDEVKPLADGRVIGIGGIDAPRGLGDHFFFALRPAGPPDRATSRQGRGRYSVTR